MPPTVSALWLIDRHSEPDLVILHVAFNRRDYLREHIPDARFIWFSWLSPSTPDGSTEMAPPEEARRVLQDLGLSNDSRVVVYFTGGTVSTTTRTILSLDYFGFDGRVALLDGGIEAWKRAGGAVTTEVPQVLRTSLTLSTLGQFVTTADEVRASLGDPSVTIIDARSANFYEGSGGGTRPGHIKGAISLPYTSVVDSLNQYKPVAALERIFRDAGVKKGSTVVAYCHVGQQATVILHAARMLGFPVRLYDGSYEEWSSLDPELYPVESKPPTEHP